MKWKVVQEQRTTHAAEEDDTMTETNATKSVKSEKAAKAAAKPFAVGDSVKVHVKIREGEKERVQVFAGTVIAMKSSGATRTFTVRRISHGVGVERIFPVKSPHIAKVEIESRSSVRRAKLYFLRNRTGKTARLKTSGMSAG